MLTSTGWEVRLSGSKTLFDASNVQEGPFLKSSGETFFTQKVHETGYFVLDCTFLGDIQGASGNGDLATITFHVKAAGSCELQLYETTLVDSSERLITHTTRNSYFSSHP